MWKIYKKFRNKIQEEINAATHLSLTSNSGITSSVNLSFLSITPHWITANFEQKSTILRITPLEVSHAAIDTSECITDTVQQHFS